MNGESNNPSPADFLRSTGLGLCLVAVVACLTGLMAFADRGALPATVPVVYFICYFACPGFARISWFAQERMSLTKKR